MLAIAAGTVATLCILFAPSSFFVRALAFCAFAVTGGVVSIYLYTTIGSTGLASSDIILLAILPAFATGQLAVQILDR